MSWLDASPKENDDERLFALEPFTATPLQRELVIEAFQQAEHDYGARLQRAAADISYERGELEPTLRIVEDAKHRLASMQDSSSAENSTRAFGGLLGGLGLSGVIAILAGSRGLPLILATIIGCTLGVALVAQPKFYVRLVREPRRKR